jgi:hypothetical protein
LIKEKSQPMIVEPGTLPLFVGFGSTGCTPSAENLQAICNATTTKLLKIIRCDEPKQFAHILVATEGANRLLEKPIKWGHGRVEVSPLGSVKSEFVKMHYSYSFQGNSRRTIPPDYIKEALECFAVTPYFNPSSGIPSKSGHAWFSRPTPSSSFQVRFGTDLITFKVETAKVISQVAKQIRTAQVASYRQQVAAMEKELGTSSKTIPRQVVDLTSEHNTALPSPRPPTSSSVVDAMDEETLSEPLPTHPPPSPSPQSNPTTPSTKLVQPTLRQFHLSPAPPRGVGGDL